MIATALAALVAAAVSLKAPLEDASAKFVAANPGAAIEFSFGASGQLAAQIEQGAPVDLFLSASPVEMDRLVKSGKIDTGTRAAVAGNRLVVIVPAKTEAAPDMEGLRDPRFAKIAIGNTKTVPAGRYAQESLESSHLSEVLATRLVFGENVRQVVDIVARGEADAGFVYATDVPLGGDAVKRAFDVPGSAHSPIVYEAAVVPGGSGTARAKAFLEFLSSPAGREIFVKRGFVAPGAPATK